MYKPLPDSTEVKKSFIHGKGLFARTKIVKGTILGVSHVGVSHREEYNGSELFPDGWIRTPLGGFYNHSMAPNCELVAGNLVDGVLTEVRFLKTITDIKIGEELTCTYTLWKKEDIAKLISINEEDWLGL